MRLTEADIVGMLLFAYSVVIVSAVVWAVLIFF
jgi:hypothetical protein